MECPKQGCKFSAQDKEDWVDHFKKYHKDVKELRLGPELVKLK